MDALRKLWVEGNPCCSDVMVKQHCIMMSLLDELDGKAISDNERSFLLSKHTRTTSAARKPSTAPTEDSTRGHLTPPDVLTSSAAPPTRQPSSGLMPRLQPRRSSSAATSVPGVRAGSVASRQSTVAQGSVGLSDMMVSAKPIHRASVSAQQQEPPRSSPLQ
eukprot:TRINITY_DN3665_c0_g1_i3.p2 TRINITY_DN3665_c0_g1~~TRINITY_DN3665_c0_g1_i3.p2  ORF type:complete len:162 (+),score=29.98 TRINITY_DN3665_c0_g1_i3:741-1226(+)